MKKFILILLIFTAIITCGFASYTYFQRNKYPTVDTSTLESINVDGVSYKTTGTIPNKDESSQIILKEIVLLGSMGVITTNEYQISVEDQGDVVIKLQEPYEKNKQKALDWLNSNGFSNIPQNDIFFQEIK